jgi:hypothetical protein
MGSNYGRGYTTFGGAEGEATKDKSTLDVVTSESGHNPTSKGDNSTVQPNFMNDGDAVGVQSGLSAEEDFDAQTEVGPTYNYAEDPMTGNFMERPNPYDQDKTVSGKAGHTFMIDR